MAKENWQKYKLLKLLELLRQETDEQHPLTTGALCDALDKMGIPCERRTLAGDVALLNELGYEIMFTWVGRSKAYYIEDRSFSLPELKLLMDAVQAASFVTEKKTGELVDKVAALGGAHRGEILKSNMVHFNTRKHTNESIYYNIDCLEKAIQENKKVIFLYFDRDERGRKVYRRGGHHYVVEPLALVFNEDNYYLVVYSARHDNTASYRVDRMDRVEIVEEDMTKRAVRLRKSMDKYSGKALKMYGGELVDVTLAFHRRALGAVYDTFGEALAVTASSPELYEATVQVQLSPVFWGWVFQFAGEMKILSPEPVIREYRQRLEQAQRGCIDCEEQGTKE